MSSRRRSYGYGAGPTHVVHHSPRPMMGGYGGGGMHMGGGRCPPPRQGYGEEDVSGIELRNRDYVR
jgi:hypothetical protein